MDQKKTTQSETYEDYIQYSYEDLVGLKSIYEQRILDAEENSFLTKLSNKFGKEKLEKWLVRFVKGYMGLVILIALIVFIYAWSHQVFNPNNAMEFMPQIFWGFMIMIGLMVPFSIIQGLLDNHRPKGLYRKFNMLTRVIEAKERLGEGNIEPSKPFSNKVKYLGCISNCHPHLKWIDKYFNSDGIRLLHEALGRTSLIKNIQILTTLSSLGNDSELRSNFKHLQKEWKGRGVKIEMRILDSKDSNSIHDRYLLSNKKGYLFISSDVMKRGQLSTIKSIDPKTIDFDNYWSNGKDIVKDWSSIAPKN